MHAKLTLICVALASCGLERGVITLDESDGIPPINVDRTFKNLPKISDTNVPDGPVTFQTDGTTTYTATLSTDADGSRTLTFSDTVTVFSESQSRQVSQKLSGWNIDSVNAVIVDVTSFALKDATRTPETLIDPSGLKALSVKLNGKELINKTGVQTLQGGGTLSVRLEREDVSPFTTAIKQQKAATAKFDIVVSVTKSALQNFPTAVHVIVKAQPKVEVSLLKAAGIQ